jgi:L-ascorbate metabolism protein UlaG (beta-lactamase superfamily)
MGIPDSFEVDLLPTPAGDLQITFLGHGSLLFAFGGLQLYVDPFSQVADYSRLPKADLILLTHEHMDHLDPLALGAIRTEKTVLALTEACASQLSGGIVMQNGEERTLNGVLVQAVAAYNIVHTRAPGKPFHPKGAGNGYILTFGGLRVYVAGDSENTPEMKALKDIDIAFLPVNLPYTMTLEMAADAARAIQPRIVYPYHFGETPILRLAEMLKDEQKIEVRIRKMN